jgi:DNA-binding transcriptional LysR family regulator
LTAGIRKLNDDMEGIHDMNLNKLDLNLIKVLDALLEERNVTRAGERIGLSQPAVSSALNRLRHVLGDQLLVRSGNEMVPTPRAESLREPVRAALVALGQALWQTEPFDPMRLERTFALLSSDFFSTLFMPAFAARIFVGAPQTKIILVDSAKGHITELLAAGIIDAALERPRVVPKWISRKLLFTAPFVVAMRKGHPALADMQRQDDPVMPLDVFCELPHAIRSIDGTLTGFADEALARINRRRTVALALPHFHAVGLAVAETDLIACLPIQFTAATADALDLVIFRPPLEIERPEISMYWHARNDELPEHVWFRTQILDVMDTLGFAVDQDKKAAQPGGLLKNSIRTNQRE